MLPWTVSPPHFQHRDMRAEIQKLPLASEPRAAPSQPLSSPSQLQSTHGCCYCWLNGQSSALGPQSCTRVFPGSVLPAAPVTFRLVRGHEGNQPGAAGPVGLSGSQSHTWGGGRGLAGIPRSTWAVMEVGLLGFFSFPPTIELLLVAAIPHNQHPELDGTRRDHPAQLPTGLTQRGGSVCCMFLWLQVKGRKIPHSWARNLEMDQSTELMAAIVSCPSSADGNGGKWGEFGTQRNGTLSSTQWDAQLDSMGQSVQWDTELYGTLSSMQWDAQWDTELYGMLSSMGCSALWDAHLISMGH